MKIEHLSDIIINMYTNRNMTTVQIADKLKCSSSAVGRLLNRHGIKPLHTPNELSISKEHIKIICERYINGETTEEICKDFGICAGSVSKLLKENGVVLRSAARRSVIKNHHYFETIDTIPKAYFLGWMISDGSIIENKTRSGRQRVISLEIKSADKHILELFAEEIGLSVDKIRTNKKREHSYIRFSSDIMSNDLAKYGVIPKKTWHTYLPSIRQDLMQHLLRGIFDGDGTVTIDSHKCVHFAFYGSRKLCEDISTYLNQEIGLKQNKVSKSTCYHVWWGGVVPPRLFYNYLYNDCDDYVLDRKRIKFLNVIANQGNTEVINQISQG